MLDDPDPQRRSLQDAYYMNTLVPEDHELVQIDKWVDFDFVREMVGDLYSPDTGRPGRDPALLLRLCFLQSYYDWSDREVMKWAETDLAVRYFLHIDSNYDLPHPTSLTKFRQRLGPDRFEEIFNRSVKMAVERGLVEGDMVLVDSYGVVANVAIPKLRKLLMRLVRKGIDALDSFGVDTEWYFQKAQAFASDDSWALSKKLREKDLQRWFELCKVVRDDLEQVEVSEEQQAERSRVLKLLDKGLKRHEDAEDEGGKLVSDVDADARWSRRERGKDPFTGYKQQIATDAESEIITAADVTPANVDDKTQLQGLLASHRRNTGGNPSAVAADRGYTGGGNREDVAKRGAKDYIAIPTAKGHHNDRYSATDFDVEFDEDGVPIKVQCPEGEVAYDGTWQEDKEGWRFYLKKHQCEGCPSRSKCSSADYGRNVFISKYYQYNEDVRRRSDTEKFEQAQIERLGIERTFAYQQRRSGADRTRYRGLRSVKAGVFLACFMTNVVRITTRCRGAPLNT